MVRFLLLLGAIIAGVFLLAAHGVRGLFALVALVLLVTVPGTRVWQVVEHRLVGLTGSRMRAAALVLFVVVVGMAAFQIYQLSH